MASLKLGIADDGNQPQNVKKYLESIHATLDSALQNKAQFRDESQWRSMRTIPGNSIKEFQQFLMDAGFLLPETPDGIYGYRTRAGARLFQEYGRSGEGLEAIGAPARVR
jgi:peptidoglycan hydrolase-like protein with peptidoglycan-binding domain